MSEWALFIGAGVSRPAPTSKEIKSKILDAVTKVVNQNLKEARGHLPNMANLTTALSLEVFLQCWVDSDIGVPLSSLEKAFETVGPNHCHHIIARLIAGGRLNYVVTTNFDTYLEKALEHPSLGIPCCRGASCNISKAHVHVISDEREFTFPSCGSPCVFKLHGSLDRKETVRIAMRQVGTNLPPNKRKVLAEIFDLYDITVIGYGGRDLDIKSTLALSYKPYWKVTWIDESEKGLSTAEPLIRALRADPKVLTAETYLERIEKEYLRDCACPTLPKKDCVEWNLDDWASTLESWTAMSAVAYVLDRSGRSNEALDWRRDALAYARRHGSLELLPPSVINIGYSLQRVFRYQDVIDFFEQWKGMIDSWNPYHRSNWHSILGSAHYWIRQPNSKPEDLDAAITHYSTAEQGFYTLAQDAYPLVFKGDSVNLSFARPILFLLETRMNKALVLKDMGRLKESKGILETVAKELEKLGDKDMLSTCLLNLGSVYYLLREPDNALKVWATAAVLKEDLGDQLGAGRCYHNIAGIALSRGEIDYARELLEKDLFICEQFHDELGAQMTRDLLNRLARAKQEPTG